MSFMASRMAILKYCSIGLLLLWASSISFAQEPKFESRILKFPSDRSLGIVYVGPPADTPLGELNVFGTDFQEFGLAKGAISVPENAFIRLDISLDGCSDLKPLGQLPADAIHFLYFNIGSPVSGQLQHISTLKSLRVLHLRSCPIKDEDIKHLSELKSLESIQCSSYGYEKEGYGITDESMKIFGKLPKLKHLFLRANPVTDEGLKPLGNCEQLEILSLNGSRVSGKGLNSLMMLHNLKSLSLGAYRQGSPIDLKGMKTFGSLLQLEHLNLSGSSVTDEELLQVQSLKLLKSLTLDFTEVTDAGLASLAGLDQLEEIRFYRSRGRGLGDRAAEELAKLPSLKKVTAHWKLTPRGIDHLARMEKLESVDLSNTVTDLEIPLIAKLKNLKRLSLQNCRVTDKGVQLLEPLDQLEALDLIQTQATVSCFESVAKLNLKSLRFVDVDKVFETWPGKHWTKLAEMQQLERLSVEGVLLDSRHWDVIGKVKSLNSLEIVSRLPMDSAAVENLSALHNLQSLDLNSCHFVEEDANRFSGLKKLEYLNLTGNLDEEFLLGLAHLPSLRILQFFTSRKLQSAVVEAFKRKSRTLQSLNIGDSSENILSKDVNGIVTEGSPTAHEALAEMLGKTPPVLIGLEGEYDLKRYKGRPVLVHFWNARPYLHETPPSDHIASVVSKFPHLNLQVIGVHRAAKADRMPGYVADYNVNWPCFVDKDSQSAKLWKNPGNGQDHLYLIGADGKLKIARVYLGDLENALLNMESESGN